MTDETKIDLLFASHKDDKEIEAVISQLRRRYTAGVENNCGAYAENDYWTIVRLRDTFTIREIGNPRE